MQLLHDTVLLIFDHASLVSVVPLPLSICSVVRSGLSFAQYSIILLIPCAQSWDLFLVTPACCGAKPERPCNPLDGHTRYLGVMETNRAVVGVAHRSRSLDIDIRRLLHHIIHGAQNLDARASRFTRGIHPPPPVHSPSLSRHWCSRHPS